MVKNVEISGEKRVDGGPGGMEGVISFHLYIIPYFINYKMSINKSKLKPVSVEIIIIDYTRGC